MSKRILIVDDVEPLADLFRDYFSFKGYEVKSAYNPYAALDEFAIFQPDLVITDVMMPGMNGIELATRMKAQKPAQKIIFLTGCAPGSNLWLLLEDQPHPCISKPARMEEVMLPLVNRLLAAAPPPDTFTEGGGTSTMGA